MGVVIQYEGITLESSAKYLAKCTGLRTQKHHKSISIQTAIRYHEDLNILECEIMPHEHYKCNMHYNYFNQGKK